MDKKKRKGHKISKGESFGEFNFGSTIVLIFEAPNNFEFEVAQNDKIFYGNKLFKEKFN